MNVRNTHVHVMACVVKRETHPILWWKLCEFQHVKSTSDSGMYNIGWRGSYSREQAIPESEYFESSFGSKIRDLPVKTSFLV